MRIALVSRELRPDVFALARVLADGAEVTVFTSEAQRDLVPADVACELVAEPDPGRLQSFLGVHHQWSARVLDALAGSYPGGGPDLVEFGDRNGEGAVSIQARRSFDPRLRRTCVCVRLTMSAEIAAVLEGRLDPDFHGRATFELERYALANADRLVSPGGDVLGAYERFYAGLGLAPAVDIRPAHQEAHPLQRAPSIELGDGEPLRLLFSGSAERRAGLYNLLRGVLDLERDDWRLTVAASDSDTGPLGISARRYSELALSGDLRVAFRESPAPDQLSSLIADHHVLVIPSLWECWSPTAITALLHGRPLLATPVGGLVEMVRGGAGWLAPGSDPRAIEAAVEQVLDARGELAAAGEDSLRAAARLTDADPIRAGYLELANEAAAKPLADSGSARPLVSVIVTYHGLAGYIEETIQSLCGQTYAELEILIVNDGSFDEADRILETLAERYPVSVVTQPNSGLSSARNFGIAVSHGRYVLPFDADDIAEPDLVERCVDALQANPERVYAATWSTFMHEDGTTVDDGDQPLGNASVLVRDENVAGAAASLFCREIFESGFEYEADLPSYEDWYLFRRLHEAGLFGLVVPRRLFRYRIRSESMLRQIGDPARERFREEMETRLREREVEWVAP